MSKNKKITTHTKNMVSIKFFAFAIFSSSPVLVTNKNPVYTTDHIIAHHNIHPNTLAACIISWLADSVKLGVDAM